MKAQRLRRLSSDRISTLPADIIETILCLLPTKEAARTSVLSGNWRYKWTKISKLEFDMESFAISRPWGDINIDKKRRLLDALCQVVLLHQGPINELTLSAFPDNNCVEINEMILHLSIRNTVEKLRLSYFDKLPLSVFSFHKLMELYLHKCNFLHQPTTFDGFGSLTTLHLEYVNISRKTLPLLLSNCPLLKTFTLFARYGRRRSSDDESTLIELFECFRVIENVTICVTCLELKLFGQLPHSRELATSLLHLKYICIKVTIIEIDGYELPFLFLLMRSSPNLQKIKAQISTARYNKVEMDSSYASMVDCSDIKLEHLIDFEFEDMFDTLKPLEFVKFILAKSPVLKKARIILTDKIGVSTYHWMRKISRLVFSFPCASTGVKIITEKSR